MCTAITVTKGDNYFGRNLDYEHTFCEKITITPRNYPFSFKNGKKVNNHYALIGMSLPYEGYPLYFDATNEKGLSMAGLNFVGNAKYEKSRSDKENIASFEFISWILCQCKTVSDAKTLIKDAIITDDAYSKDLKPTSLHWLIADKNEAITVEQTKDGMKIYKNSVGVLTNNPTFDIQMFNLNNYLSLSNEKAVNKFFKELNLEPYSNGMGAIGLPGDLSSMSRFVKACFMKLNSVFGKTEEEKVNHFFHILYSVYQQKGCVKTDNGFEMTNYTSCCNTTRGIYYYTTYNNSRIYAVDMHRENLDCDRIITFDMIENEKFCIQNQ